MTHEPVVAMENHHFHGHLPKLRQLHRCNTLLVAMRTSRPKLPDSLGGKSYIKSPFLIGKPSINGPFSMAMLNNQRVYQISMIDVKIPIKFSYL